MISSNTFRLKKKSRRHLIEKLHLGNAFDVSCTELFTVGFLGIDMFLLTPEWQGYGTDDSVYRGALAIYEELKQYPFHVIDIQTDDDISLANQIRGHHTILSIAQRVRALIQEKSPSSIFMIGGTCGSELIPVSYLNELYKGALTVIWFDAHGDLNTPTSSPSGRFHGMVLRTLLGEGDSDLLKLIERPLFPHQVVLAGARDLDPPEQAFIEKSKICVLQPAVLRDASQLMHQLKKMGNQRLYLHIDLDFFDPISFPNVLVPTKNGIPFQNFEKILSALNKNFEVVGFSIVEHVLEDAESLIKVTDLLNGSGIMSNFLR